MVKKFDYVNSPEFLEFLNREFNTTTLLVSVEELAVFAFGGIDEAVREFKKQKHK